MLCFIENVEDFDNTIEGDMSMGWTDGVSKWSMI
jgi:hypothetical protein